MVRWQRAACAVTMMMATTAWGQTTQPYPRYESYVPERQQQFVADAQAWLRGNAASSEAPRVTLDVLAAATATGNGSTAAAMRGQLFREYGQSVPARYVLTTFKDADAVVEALMAAMDTSEPLVESRIRSLLAVIEQAQSIYGPKVMESDRLAARCAVLARLMRMTALEETATARLAVSTSKDRQPQQVAAICVDPAQTAIQQIQRLHELKGDAPFFERLLMDGLSLEQRKQPVIEQIEAENLLRRHLPDDFAKALALLETLPDGQGGAKVLSLKAWCHAVRGDAAGATKLADEAGRSFPNDPWAKQAAEIAQYAAGSEQLLGSYAVALADVSKRIQQGIDVLQMNLAIPNDAGSATKVYFGVSPEACEIQVHRGMTLGFACRTVGKGCRLFLADQAVIYEFAQGGLLPDFGFGVERDPADASFHWSLNMQMAQGGQPLRKALQALASSPYLTTVEGMTELLRHQMRRGSLFVALRDVPEGRTLTLATPRADEPTMTRFELTIDKDAVISQLKLGGGAATFSYGKAGSLALNPPAWPEARVMRQPKLEASAFLRLMQSVFAMVQSGE